MDAVQLGTDPVKRAKEGKLQPFVIAIGVDDTIEHLFGAGIDPALLGNRTQHEWRGFFIKLAVGRHAIDLGGGGKDDPFFILVAQADDFEVLFEVQFKNPQRVLDIGYRCSDGHQRQNNVALLDIVLDPFLVDGNVTFQKMEAGVAQGTVQLVTRHIEAKHLPVGGGKDAVSKSIADKAVDAQNEDFHEFS